MGLFYKRNYVPLPRPRSSLLAGASLPRRKIDFREAARRRASTGGARREEEGEKVGSTPLPIRPI